MPTISQLPLAILVSAADKIPVSQGGVARATSVGVLLTSAQSAIIVDSPSLLGRTSLGPGSPEQVDLGAGIILSGGTLVADGLDHAGFPAVSTLPIEAELVISNDGRPMLLQASLLRGLFSAGQNVTIDTGGVISATPVKTITGTSQSASSLGGLPVVTGLTTQDLVAVSHAGSDCAIAYSNFLGGVTIDQAQAAAPAGDSDTIWAAQGSNVMASQTFSAIWVWIAGKLPSYKASTVEVISDTNLDTTVHNGRILICSQPVTLTPLITNMGSGFQCTVINASAGEIKLDPRFVSSNGNLALLPWQSAILSCASYSGGTIAFAAMPTGTLNASVPGQVSNLSLVGSASTTVTVSWQPPSGGDVISYIVQFRLTGTTLWSSSSSITGVTTFEIANLEPATSYDVVVEAQNAAGIGPASAVVTVVTSSSAQQATPPQVINLAATPASIGSIQLNWSAQSGGAAATGFLVQYKQTGASGWTSAGSPIATTNETISGLQAATSYDFSVTGVNTMGAGTASSIVTSRTLPASAVVASIKWNVAPSGAYIHAVGTIAVNAQVLPAASPIQFGFSLSASTPPSNWTAAILLNTNLWGAYVPTPATSGNWYAWAAGLDGSALTLSPAPILVQ